MNRKSAFALLVIGLGFTLSLIGASAFAASVYVAQAETPGFTASEGATVHELVKSAVLSNGHSLAQAPANAEFELRPKLMKLGSSVLLSISKWQKGSQTFSTSMKSPSIEELDTVTARVTRAALQNVDAYSDRTIEDVTQDEETKGNRRKQTLSGRFFGVGPAWVQNLNHTGAIIDIVYGHRWAMDSLTIRPTLEVAFYPGSDSVPLFASGSIGANYYFMKTDFSPFVNLDFGIGISKTGGSGLLSSEFRGGFVLGGGGGVAFMRTATTNLEVAVHSSYLTASNSFGHPYSLAFTVSVHWTPN